MYEDIKQYASKYAVPIMREITCNFVAENVKMQNPKYILEIGTAIGYSGIVMLNNSNAKLITIEHNKTYIKEAKKNFKKYKLSKRAKIIKADCLVCLAKMACMKKYQNHFDLVFLDGPKAQYLSMLELVLLLLKPGGTLIVDDVLFHKNLNQDGKVSKRFKTIENRLAKFIETLKNHENITDFELKEIEDGIIIAKKDKNETTKN